jgi:hypothetical protein
MIPNALGKSSLTRTLADVLGDFSDLVAKQIELARAEINANITTAVQASLWLVGAAILFVMAIGLIIEAAVFGVASTGIALHWACLIVAAVLAVIGTGLFFYGRSVAHERLSPTRSIRQMNKDISAAKEQLT